ncbi:MAG TPA: RDD family protein [Lysobacter sp.]|nr:RDD family protein [Lysobacter sp.]
MSQSPVARPSRPSPATAAAATALIRWRGLSLLYDFFAALGLWLLVAAIFVALHHDAVTGGVLGLLEFIVLWSVTGAYAMASWRRGGQTLGMRPWRLRVVAADGGVPTWLALLIRYVVGNASLLLGGLGFWWAWIDRDRLTWHDRASGTRLRREPKPAR